MTVPAGRRGDERGVLAPSSTVAALAGLAVLVGLVYYLGTGGPFSSGSAGGTAGATAGPTVTDSPSGAISTTATGTPTTTPASPSSPATPARPAVKRSSVRVDVLNASSITGLAARTATRLQKLGWAVGRVANWSGPMPKSTVFYGSGDLRAARLLASDLGLSRVRPATAGMATRGLTLVLVGNLP